MFASFSGPAPGPGPRQALAIAVGDIFFDKNHHYWTALDDDEYFTPKILRPLSSGGGVLGDSAGDEEENVLLDEVSEDTQEHFRTFGLYWQICLVWGVDFSRLSPMFALFLLTMNMRLALENTFLYAVAPKLAARLNSLPPARHPSGDWIISSMEDPYLMVVSVMPHHEVRFCLLYSSLTFLMSSSLNSPAT